jgi:hypothetical protein
MTLWGLYKGGGCLWAFMAVLGVKGLTEKTISLNFCQKVLEIMKTGEL